MELNNTKTPVTIKDLSEDKTWVEKQKQNCRFCGKNAREQARGCREISCYKQYLKKEENGNG